MATEKQRSAARKNIKRASKASRKKNTIAHMPKSERSEMGKEGAKAREDNS